jgi:hypothetical protein
MKNAQGRLRSEIGFVGLVWTPHTRQGADEDQSAPISAFCVLNPRKSPMSNQRIQRNAGAGTKSALSLRFPVVRRSPDRSGVRRHGRATEAQPRFHRYHRYLTAVRGGNPGSFHRYHRYVTAVGGANPTSLHRYHRYLTVVRGANPALLHRYHRYLSVVGGANPRSLHRYHRYLTAVRGAIGHPGRSVTVESASNRGSDPSDH